MHSQELELLLREYKNSVTDEDKLIRRKLEAIASLCTDCKSDEFIFANEITVEFCRLIRLLKEQHRDELSKMAREVTFTDQTSDTNSFLGYQKDYVHYREEYLPYRSDGELMAAFYNYLYERYLKTGKPTPATIKDYVARVNTFSTVYLWNMPRIMELWHRENENAKRSPILFVYKYLELILASFETKVDGEVNKQRSNIRSALNKLNEFKRGQELRG